METENEQRQPALSGATIHTVEPGRGVEWLVGGFRIFMKTPAFWLVAGIAILAGNWILGIIPLVGEAVAMAANVVAVGALMRAAQALENGADPVAAAQLAFSSTPLWILGAMSAALTFGLMLSLMVLGLSSASMFMLGFGAVGPVLMIGLLLMLAFFALMFMGFWLAPALVALRGLAPVEAIKLSFAAALKNLVPFLVFMVLATLASIVGAIPLGLGLLVVFPAVVASSYLAYRDIFRA